jgi:hypothetical protein
MELTQSNDESSECVTRVGWLLLLTITQFNSNNNSLVVIIIQ